MMFHNSQIFKTWFSIIIIICICLQSKRMEKKESDFVATENNAIPISKFNVKKRKFPFKGVKHWEGRKKVMEWQYCNLAQLRILFPRQICSLRWQKLLENTFALRGDCQIKAAIWDTMLHAPRSRVQWYLHAIV